MPKNAEKDEETEIIHVEVPKGHKRSHIQVLVDPESVFEKQVNGFMGFLRERTVVTIAVSFVVATQVQAVVNQLIKSFLDPLTTLLFGAQLSTEKFTLTFHGRAADFAWGAFVYQLISFFVVVVTIYMLIKMLKLDKFENKPDSKKK